MYSYSYSDNAYNISHLYLNSYGESIESEKVFPKKRQFILQNTVLDNIKSHILEGKIEGIIEKLEENNRME